MHRGRRHVQLPWRPIRHAQTIGGTCGPADTGAAHPRGRHTRPARVMLLVSVAVLIAACGKKGPPLAPIAHVPAAVDRMTARRVGHDVYVTLTVPAQNIDATRPADVRRVELYAVTAFTAPPRPRFLEIATPVASAAVNPAPLPGEPPPVVAPGAATQGMAITLRDALSAEQLEPRTLPQVAPARRPPVPAPAVTTAALAPAPPPVLHRYYMAVAFSERGRPGPPSMILELPLPTVPDPPAAIDARYSRSAVTLSWPPSGGLLGFLLDTPLPLEPPPVDEIAATAAPSSTASSGQMPAGPTRFNVYRDLAPDPLVLPPRDGATPGAAVPTPLNPAPFDALTFDDLLADDRERCYTVRAVRGTGTDAVEGDASPPVCVNPVDVFPPAAPTGISAIAAEGVISLIWEPSPDSDVAGYLVLRGSPGDATLQPLTDLPVAEPRYTDRSVTPGMRYVYAVVAIDDRLPVPNVSVASERVEETAR